MGSQLNKGCICMNSLKKPNVWLRSRLRSFFWQLSGSAHLPIYFHASPTRMAAGSVKPGLMNASVSFFLRKPSHKIMRSFCIPIKCNVFHFLCCTSFRVLGTLGGLTGLLAPLCCASSSLLLEEVVCTELRSESELDTKSTTGCRTGQPKSWSTLGNTSPRHRDSTQGDPENPPKA